MDFHSHSGGRAPADQKKNVTRHKSACKPQISNLYDKAESKKALAQFGIKVHKNSVIPASTTRPALTTTRDHPVTDWMF